MIQAFKNLFAPEAQTSDPDSRTDQSQERLKIATSVVLLEMAMADDVFAEEERQTILKTLQTRFELSEEHADELIELATQERKKSNDLWGFTHQINESCNMNEKIEIIDEVWRVVCADGSIDGDENHLIHQLGKLFNLTHEQLIDSKIRILAEFRNA